MTNGSETVYWSVVRGESPLSRAVEPAIAGVEIPDGVLTWAENHGLSMDDPDVYILVAPEDEAGEVIGEIAGMSGTLPSSDVLWIRGALDDAR